MSYDCSDGPALAEDAVAFFLIEPRPVLARCRSKLSNRGGRRRFLLAEAIIPPVLNKLIIAGYNEQMMSKIKKTILKSILKKYFPKVKILLKTILKIMK